MGSQSNHWWRCGRVSTLTWMIYLLHGGFFKGLLDGPLYGLMKPKLFLGQGSVRFGRFSTGVRLLAPFGWSRLQSARLLVVLQNVFRSL